jgi:hypothetical protein
LCLFPFQIEISDDEVQETTATVLTTALASKKPEPLSGSSDIGSFGQGSSSGTVVLVPLKDRHIQPSEVGTQADTSEVIEENKSHEPTAEVIKQQLS